MKNNIPTLCLNMIVKNESKIITRLFDSVISIIDCYCICDTGSTDNTIELIENYFKSKNITGKIVYEPFKNFSHNRNFALEACLGMSDYVLLLDADMMLEIKDFNKNYLRVGDCFTILQGNDSFYYQNVRIIKNNGLYKYIGVTHEYINVPDKNILYNFRKDKLFIRDVGDGGSKTNKFERDIKLLEDGLKEEPNNARYYFYLANSYNDTRRFNEAIETYIKRIKLGGWEQEVWYSYYRIGMCYKILGKNSDAIYYWLEAFNCIPERLENIYEIISYYRNNSKYKLCKQFYDFAIEILNKNHNRDSYLFLHNDVYKYKLYYEYSIFSSYVGIKNIDDEIIKILNNSDNIIINHNLLSNMKFYKNILNKKSVFILDTNVNTKVNEDNIKLTSSSSCLIPSNENDRYLLNIRYVNYIIEDNGSYKNCENHIISVNKFIELDRNFNVIKDIWLNLVFDGRRYIGVEDIRLFYDENNKELKYIGTGLHSNNTIGIVSGIYDINNKDVNINELKQNFNKTQCEKNWVFVNYNHDLHIIYDWYPIKICKLNKDNYLEIIETKTTPKIYSMIRGSTCGFNYSKKVGENNNGNICISIQETEIWFIGHIVSYENPRHYYHIISVFDINMNLLRYSAPIKFEGEPIEYCLSILVEDDRVLINYSTWDRTTRIGVYDKDYIESLLKYN